MTSRTGALVASPSWGRAAHPEPEEARTRGAPPARPRVRWGIRASAGADLAGGGAVLAAAAGLWAAFLLSVW